MSNANPEKVKPSSTPTPEQFRSLPLEVQASIADDVLKASEKVFCHYCGSQTVQYIRDVVYSRSTGERKEIMSRKCPKRTWINRVVFGEVHD